MSHRRRHTPSAQPLPPECSEEERWEWCLALAKRQVARCIYSAHVMRDAIEHDVAVMLYMYSWSRWVESRGVPWDVFMSFCARRWALTVASRCSRKLEINMDDEEWQELSCSVTGRMREEEREKLGMVLGVLHPMELLMLEALDGAPTMTRQARDRLRGMGVGKSDCDYLRDRLFRIRRSMQEGSTSHMYGPSRKHRDRLDELWRQVTGFEVD